MNLPSASEIATAFADLDAMNAEGRRVYVGLECWLCSQNMVPCSRPDCPKRWALKSDPYSKKEI